jgi:hypothetical protein
VIENAVYDSEHGKWYKQGDDPWTVREVARGQFVRPIVFSNAPTYLDAFAELFGHAAVIPPPTRTRQHAIAA